MATTVIGALASCTDDLSVDSGQRIGKGDLIGNLSVPVDYEMTRAGIKEDGGYSFVWTKDDQIRVFTMEALTYNTFSYTGAGGEATGAFTKDDAGVIPADDTRYGITEAANVYSVSAAKGDGKQALLTMTLDGTCEVEKQADGKTYKFPIPFWGEVTGTDAALSCDFKFLTSYLRIDLAKLPTGTKAIVLTTHGGNAYLVSDEMTANGTGTIASDKVEPLDGNHGYQLAAPVASTGKIAAIPENQGGSPNEYQDTNDWWQNVAYTTGGKCEAISGTLNATLDASQIVAGQSYVEGCQLAVDPRLVSYDTLRVDIPSVTEDNVFYVPIVAGTYKQLDVIAVTQDSKYAYRWGGTLLKSYKDTEFKLGKSKTVTMNLLTFDKADMNTLNNTIANNFKSNTNFTRTTVINVEELVNEDGVRNESLYSNVEFDIPQTAAGNLVVNIKKIADNGTDNNQFEYGTSDKKLIITDKATSAQVAGKKRTVTFNLPKDWAAENDESYVKTSLRTFQTILGTVERENSKSIIVWATGSDDKFTAGLQSIVNDENLYVEEEKTAAIRINNGIKKLVVFEPTKGDVYIYNGNNENIDGTAETEISDSLSIRSNQTVDIRMDDALAKVIGIQKGVKHWIYTTGKSATQLITGVEGNATANDAYDTHTQSFYTGAGLSDYAYANGYSVKNVYTVAQLQSMGEAARDGVDMATDVTIPTVYTVWDKVEWFWLGADKYQWVGPEVTVEGFVFDGNNRPIVNMYAFSAGGEDTYEPVYVNDPHFCCTSCGRPNLAGKVQTGAAVKLTENLGLIRSIKEQGTATIKNVTMNDVQIKNAEVNNAGALVGNVDIENALTLTNNHIGEVQIDIKGANAGGLIGTVKATAVTATNNWNVKNGSYDNYVKATQENAGGLFGIVTATGAVTATDNKVQLNGDIEAGTSYAGGVAGKIQADAAADIDNNSVVAKNITAKTGSYAAGQIGYVKATALTMDQPSVKAETISAANEYAGGLVGQSDNVIGAQRFNVEVTKKLAANEGFVGGVVGQINPDNANKVSFIGSAESNIAANHATYPGAAVGYKTGTHEASVSVAEIEGAQSLGGLVGNTKEYARLMVGAKVIDATTKNGSYIDIDVDKYTMTYPETDPLHWTNVTDRIQYGTIQDVVGLMQANVAIFVDGLTKSGWLDDDDNKKAVLVHKHIDQRHNQETQNKYWGDTYGNIGYATQGTYQITSNGVKTTIDNELEGGFNYYKVY